MYIKKTQVQLLSWEWLASRIDILFLCTAWTCHHVCVVQFKYFWKNIKKNLNVLSYWSSHNSSLEMTWFWRFKGIQVIYPPLSQAWQSVIILS